MTDLQNELVLNFCGVTSADPGAARHYLEASSWNLEAAITQFYENEEDTGDGPMDEDDLDLYSVPPLNTADPSATQAPSNTASSSKSKKNPKAGTSSRVCTLGDLSSGTVSDDEDEPKQDFFAGGEKSGLAVQDPGDQGPGSRNLIHDILRRAAEGGQSRGQSRVQDENESAPLSRFSGSGHTLGSESSQSVTIPGHQATQPVPRPSVTRTLTFWRDGFSVEDGPLMRYDDPANREILLAIENGRAPLSLMNVEPGQPTEVNVFKRLDEDYVPPKKKLVPFSGSGQRLGSYAPGESSTSAVTGPSPPAEPSAVSVNTAPASVNIDSSAPVTSLQIRLADGTRLVSRFNHTHTVGDLYSFVTASSTDSRRRNFILQTTFPTKELQEKNQSLKEAGLLNAVVVQKWSL